MVGAVGTRETPPGPLQGVIGTIASLHDDQHEPAYRDVLTYRSPTSGEPGSKTYLEARTAEEFRALPGCVHLRALRTFGLIDRLTHFTSGFLVDLSRELLPFVTNEPASGAQDMFQHNLWHHT